MRRILAIASAALVAAPLSIGAAAVAEAAPTQASDGSPQIGGGKGPLGKKKAKEKKERDVQGSSVAGIVPGDKPVEEGQDSVPDTNGLSTEDTPLGEDGPIDRPAR